METSSIVPPSGPPPFHHHRSRDVTHDHHQHRVIVSYYTALIVVPIVIVCIFVIVFSVLLLLRRAKSARNGSSFRNDSMDEKKLVQCSTKTKAANAVGLSPDVRNCIYSGRLAFPVQARYRGGNVFTYKELELATDGFSEANVIGRGGFGVVFRGNLSDGTVAAIKVLHRDGKQREREFRIEVDILSRLHSRHLVGLLGYCADQHHRLLVFEFMPSGSLQQHLHPTSSDRLRAPLDWWTRLRIALDCARGLEFLHEHSVPAVIHRDFKSSNILLDHNYRAKVSDFGMAKMGSDKIDGKVLTRVLGTTGYVAPEYASTGKLTTKSDVYSYGVVLLELLTGRVPIDTRRPPGEHVLVSWALPRLTNREKAQEMVDPALQGQYSKKELVQIAAIAAMCVQSEADYRPLITDVVQSLIPLAKNPASSFPNTPARFQHQMAIPMSETTSNACMC